MDRNTIVIAYDKIRGEVRSFFRKGEDRSAVGKGDCIDCNQCVNVCPTGIDIRNGTQLECVNCTACIDACDDIMDKINKPRGLIRYASEDEISSGKTFSFSPRLKVYTAILSALIIIMGGLLFSRSSMQATILKVPGKNYQIMDDGTIMNMFQYKILNKTTEKQVFTLELEERSEATLTIAGGNLLQADVQQYAQGILMIHIPGEHLKGSKEKLTLIIRNKNGDVLTKTTVGFSGPRNLPSYGTN